MGHLQPSLPPQPWSLAQGLAWRAGGPWAQASLPALFSTVAGPERPRSRPWKPGSRAEHSRSGARGFGPLPAMSPVCGALLGACPAPPQLLRGSMKKREGAHLPAPAPSLGPSPFPALCPLPLLCPLPRPWAPPPAQPPPSRPWDHGARRRPSSWTLARLWRRRSAPVRERPPALRPHRHPRLEAERDFPRPLFWSFYELPGMGGAAGEGGAALPVIFASSRSGSGMYGNY